jgi:hypothetical protein
MLYRIALLQNVATVLALGTASSRLYRPSFISMSTNSGDMFRKGPIKGKMLVLGGSGECLYIIFSCSKLILTYHCLLTHSCISLVFR